MKGLTLSNCCVLRHVPGTLCGRRMIPLKIDIFSNWFAVKKKQQYDHLDIIHGDNVDEEYFFLKFVYLVLNHT